MVIENLSLFSIAWVTSTNNTQENVQNAKQY